MRSLGVNPTQAQVTGVVDQLAALHAEQGDPASLLQQEHVEQVVSNFLIQQEASLMRDDYHTLIRAFRAFDAEGKGWVDAENLKLLLCARGEPMSEEEVQKMLMFAADESGRVYYVRSKGGGRGCAGGMRAGCAGRRDDPACPCSSWCRRKTTHRGSAQTAASSDQQCCGSACSWAASACGLRCARVVKC